MTAVTESVLPRLRHSRIFAAWAAAFCGVAVAAAASAQQPPRPAVPVEMTEVETRTVVDEVAAVGTLRANESVVIRPEIGGRIVRITFDEGTVVAEGASLFAIDDTIYRAELAQARASLELSRRNLERANELYQKGAGTSRSRDEAQAKFVNDQASVELAQARLDKTLIQAPFAGVTGFRRVSVGAYVQPGQDLVDLADVDPIKVDFRVPERFVPALAVGQKLSVQVDSFPGEEFRGEVFALSPEVDPQGRSIAIRALVPNDQGRLRPGLFARVRLIVATRPDAMTIPEQAVVPRGQERFVFKVDNGAVKLTKIEILKRGTGWVEVVSGLRPGDTIVTAGQIKLYDGAAVTRAAPGDGPAGG